MTRSLKQAPAARKPELVSGRPQLKSTRLRRPKYDRPIKLGLPNLSGKKGRIRHAVQGIPIHFAHRAVESFTLSARFSPACHSSISSEREIARSKPH